MIRIIDNKKVDLTNDEFILYEKICRSYDRANFKGEYLFEDLFESDSKGFITFLKPPTNYTTPEVVFFLINIMVHQHLRKSCGEADAVIAEARKTIFEMREMIHEMKRLKG
jgi:hypothetical protein